MLPPEINAPVIGDHLIDLLASEFGQKVLEQIEQVSSDIAPQKLVADRVLTSCREHRLNSAADINRGVNKSTVDVKKINAELSQKLRWLRSFAAQQTRHRLAALGPEHLLLLAAFRSRRLRPIGGSQRPAVD